MSIFEVHGGPITHRYLMNKTKYELASMYMRLLRETEQDAKDAARYRKIRPPEAGEEGRHGGWPNPGTPVVLVIREIRGMRSPQDVTGEELGAILDAAMGDEGNG